MPQDDNKIKPPVNKSIAVEAEKMLDQADGYKYMLEKINEQKAVTRTALSYAANASRDE